MISPLNGSTFTSTDVTFKWKNTGATKYDIYVFTADRDFDFVGGESLYTSIKVPNLPSDGRTIYVRLWTSLDDEIWEYNDYVYKSYNNKTQAISKLFIGYENHINNNTKVRNGSILENINLIFQPQINVTEASGFSLKFENGGFTKENNLFLCVGEDEAGKLIDFETSNNNIMTSLKFQFYDYVTIEKGANITFHKNSCWDINPIIKADGASGSIIKAKINEGISNQGTSIPDYNTNSVQISKIEEE